MKQLWCAVVLLVVSVPCSARDIWVDKSSLGGACNDTAVATKTAPLCTLGAAAEQVVPGDVVRVRGGTYNETQSRGNGNSVLQLLKAGTSAQPIRFIGEAGEEVILEGTARSLYGVRIVAVDGVLPVFNEVKGFTIRNFSQYCVGLDSVPDIKLVNLDVSKCGHGAVELHRAQRVSLIGSKIHDSVTTGWTSPVDLWLCKDGNLISGNIVWNNFDSPPSNADTEGHGISLDYCTGQNNVVDNNVVLNNEGYCIVVFHSAGATIRNNTCYQNAIRTQDSGEISVQSNNVTIYNNIVVPRVGRFAMNIQGSSNNFQVDLSTISENNNLFGVSPTATVISWGDLAGTVSQYQSGNGRGWGTATIVGNAMFVSPVGYDFRLQSSSPAIDKGNAARASQYDFAGNPRTGVPDIGAFEFGVTTPTPTPTPIPDPSPTPTPTPPDPTPIPDETKPRGQSPKEEHCTRKRVMRNDVVCGRPDKQ